MLEPRDPVEGTRELEGSREVDLRVLPPKDGPVRLVVGRRIEPEPELFGGDADSTRERLRGTNTPVGEVRVAPGEDVRLPIVGGLADGLRGAAAAGVPIRFARELPTRGPGFVLGALLTDPFGIVLRDDRLRAPVPPVVLDWPPIVGVGREVGRGLPREVFNAPILERVLGANTLGVVLRPVFARRAPALVAGAVG